MDELSDIVDEYLDRYFEILDNMINSMISIDIDNNISRGFISQMLAHQQAGIQLALNVLQFSDDEELREIAEDIIEEQEESIEDLQRAMLRCENVTNPNFDVANYERTYNYIIETMFVNMANAAVEDNVEIDFINEMIPYHVGGVSLIRNAMRFQLCNELDSVLRDMGTTQSEFVSEIRRLYENRQLS